jgi:hypothetical protein
MLALTASIGALALRLVSVERRVLPELRTRPLLRLEDGTEVLAWEFEGKPALVVDHRRDTMAMTRIERWAPEGPADGEFLGLYVLVESVPSGMR